MLLLLIDDGGKKKPNADEVNKGLDYFPHRDMDRGESNTIWGNHNDGISGPLDGDVLDGFPFPPDR